MKLEIFFLIFSLKFILHSCIEVKYYQYLIEKYSDKVTVSPNYYRAVGFVLDVKDFEENKDIYFKISIHGDNDLMVMIKFESTFDITEETDTTEFSTVKSSSSLQENSKKTTYYKTTKNSNLNYLKIVIYSQYGFASNIDFKNTKKDESKKHKTLFIVLIIVFVLLFIILIVLSILCARYRRAKRAKIYDGIYDQNQMYGQPMYGQPMYGQPMYGQPINTQQQMKVQQQTNDQQENNLENNMNMAQNNQPSPLPVNQQETTPIKQK